MDPTTPGWRTTEGWTTAFKALAGTAALFCSMFNIGLPATAGPEGQWVGVAAFIASTVAVAVYSRQRTALKKQVAVLNATTTGTPAAAATPFVPVTVSDAGYGLIELCFALLLIVVALVILFHYVH